MSLEKDLDDFLDMIVSRRNQKTLKKIYFTHTGEESKSKNFVELKKEYSDIIKTEEDFSSLILVARDYLENFPDAISKSLYEIIDYRDVVWGEVIGRLEDKKVDFGSKSDIEGYEIKKTKDGLYSGAYYYSQKTGFIDGTGKFRTYIKPQRVLFELNPEDGIIKVQTARVSDVVKLINDLKNVTGVEIDVLGSFVTLANPRQSVEDFIREFGRGGVNPFIKEINMVELFNPEEQRARRFNKIRFEGTDIYENEQIEDLVNSDWIVTKIGMILLHNEEKFDVIIGGNLRLTYVKVKIGRNVFEIGKELQKILEKSFIKHFR